jgi:uncharacterized protein (DUF302 family)
VNDTPPTDTVEQASPWVFDLTLERLERAIANAGMTVFAKIDHAANARSIGMAMPAATVLVYGAAKGGTPVMLATPLAALDLPLRVLVREGADGKVSIAFHPVVAMLGRVGVAEDTAARLAPAQRVLLSAVTP